MVTSSQERSPAGRQNEEDEGRSLDLERLMGTELDVAGVRVGRACPAFSVARQQ